MARGSGDARSDPGAATRPRRGGAAARNEPPRAVAVAATREIAAVVAIAVVVAIALPPLAPAARAATILVPEEQALAAAIASAQPGDTLSLSGTFDRVPAPFVKSLTLVGRDPANPPLLRGLAAGDCRLVDLDFAPAALTGEPLPLVEVLGPIDLVRCRFTGQTRTGVRAADDVATPLVVRLDECRFETLVRALDADFVHPASRCEVRGGEFLGLLDGITVTTPVRDCPPGDPGEAPPIPAGAAAVTIENALLDGITGAAIRVENATNGLDLRNSRLVNYARGVELVRAGARIDDSELDGMTAGAIGVDGVSCRLELTRSWVRFHETGVRLRGNGGCERNGGFIGGSLETSCGLVGNLTGVDSIDPLPIEANWWGALDCGVAAQEAPGLSLRFIVDETRGLLFDCLTPVRAATWSRIKSGLSE
jgi:hypothetical protein